MTIACDAPDPALGVTLRLAAYLDCQGRALGENGFLAIAGGPVATGLLSGLMTIFVALIGYRLLLGEIPSLRDGVGWAARLGIVLALATGWPAFQVLVYRVAVDGPVELANLLLPATGLPVDDLNSRVQQAYDTIRLGSDDGAAVLQASVQPQQPQPSRSAEVTGSAQPSSAQRSLVEPHPQTASVFAVSIVGVAGALRIAIGLLLALGPLAILALLFDATLGVFSGWVRALSGSAVGLLAAIVATALDLIAVESELRRVHDRSLGIEVQLNDPEAVTTIVLLFAIVIPLVTIVAGRISSAFSLTPRPIVHGDSRLTSVPAFDVQGPVSLGAVAGNPPAPSERRRAAAVADALNTIVRREQLAADKGAGIASASSMRRMTIMSSDRLSPDARALGITGRRSAGRRTRSTAARDERA